ncbi:MAG: toll/interleukin-1 receptor domain-containing protein [Chloroflexi bacterium]|nr:toll/interleukin-1 receptor domain-containing protein [Chloroflexota bacterium]
MPHIFISYDHANIDITRRVCTDLSAAGLDIWMDDKLTPGTPSWEIKIETAIETAAAVVVILSPEAKKSEWVRQELRYANDNEKLIFPVLAGGDKRSAIPISLNQVQWVDIRSNYSSITNDLLPAILAHLQLKPIVKEKAVTSSESSFVNFSIAIYPNPPKRGETTSYTIKLNNISKYVIRNLDIEYKITPLEPRAAEPRLSKGNISPNQTKLDPGASTAGILVFAENYGEPYLFSVAVSGDIKAKEGPDSFTILRSIEIHPQL